MHNLVYELLKETTEPEHHMRSDTDCDEWMHTQLW